MKPHAKGAVPAVPAYEKPAIVDYGSLVDLTAANEAHGGEDGLGKRHGMESHPM